MGVRAGKTRLGLLVTLLLAAPAAAGIEGCKACESAPAFVARLTELRGTATRAVSIRPDAWTQAPAGTTFVVGDALRTGAATRATVELTAGGALRLGENTLVRFLAQGEASGGGSVGVETGEAEVETGGGAMQVQTPVGLARFAPGSRVRVHASAADSGFEVVVGKAEIEGDGGAVATVEASQRLVVTAGRAVVESIPATAPADAAVPEGDAGAEGGAVAAAVAVEGVDAEVRGSGVRASQTGAGPLTVLGEGHVAMSDGARLVVPDGATVALSRGAERAVVVGRAEILVGHAGGPLLESRAGQVVLTSPSVGTRIEVPGGSIVLTAAGAGSRQAQIRVEHQTARVVAEAGQIELRGRLGTATVAAGQNGALDGRGAAQVESIGPTTADLDVPSGESSVIHSPRGSVAVRIHLDGVCDGDALVEVTSGRGKRSVFVRAGGPAAAVVALGAGAFGDRVRCVDAQGRPGEARQPATLQVLRDSGAQPVPRTAPHDVVDADGRHYSVLYQNLLPQITMRWPRAPQGAKTSAHVEAAKGQAQVFSSGADSASAAAGALAEGSYRFWFEVDGDPSTRSPDTTLRVAFDNAAPAAELQQPIEGQATAGVVQVAGVAVEGATVSVDGVAMPLDGAFRFRGEVTAGVGDLPNRSIAVRIALPSHGVHYYLRTIGGA